MAPFIDPVEPVLVTRVWIDKEYGTVYALKVIDGKRVLVCAPETSDGWIDLTSDFDEPYPTDFITQEEIDAIKAFLEYKHYSPNGGPEIRRIHEIRRLTKERNAARGNHE